MLIVDDEPWVQQGLVKSIPWSDLGIQIVGSAFDGKTALDIYKKTAPEIVLTDIKMPIMDGLQLSSEINKINKNTYIIFMSAYDEFEYARKAIEVNVKRYILKPFGKEEIISIVEEACEEIKQDRAKNQAIEAGKLYLKEQILNRIISGVQDGLANLLSQYVAEDLDISNKKIGVYAAKINIDSSSSSKNSKSDIKHINSNVIEDVINIFIELSRSNQLESIIHYMEEKSIIIGLIISPAINDWNSVKEVLSKGCDICRDKLKLSIKLGIGNIYNSINKAHESYVEAITALNYATIAKGTTVQFFGDICSSTTVDNSEIFSYYQKIEHVIKGGSAQDIKDVIAELDEVIIKVGILSKFGVKDIMLQLVEIPIRILVEYGYGIENVLGGKYMISDYLNQIQTFKEFKKWFTSFLVSINKLISNDNTSIREEVKIAKDYIDKNYNKELTLEEVAEKVMLTPCYFSRIFKNEAGKSFIKYLTDVRINKAKELLNDYSLKIYQVSYMVGYDNVKHFVSTFKKQVGLSPSEYRRNICWGKRASN